MMSFLFVDTEPVWRGGQDQLLTLLRGLLPRGHRVHLICHPKTLLEERAREAGVCGGRGEPQRMFFLGQRTDVPEIFQSAVS